MAFTLRPEQEGKVGGGAGGVGGGAEGSKLEVGGGGGTESKKNKKQLDATCLEFKLCCHVTARP